MSQSGNTLGNRPLIPQLPRLISRCAGISKCPSSDVRKRSKVVQGHHTWAQAARSQRTHQERNPHKAASLAVKSSFRLI